MLLFIALLVPCFASPAEILSEVERQALQAAMAKETSAFAACTTAFESDRGKAGPCFDDFAASYPTSEHASTALYNAAISYQDVGKVKEAIRRFEHFVSSFPEDELSPPLQFRLAGNYVAVLELDAAVLAYEQVLKHAPDSREAPSATYDLGFVRLCLGDHDGAARAFDQYAALGLPDAEHVRALAIRARQQAKAPTRARYLSANPLSPWTSERSPSEAMVEAQRRLRLRSGDLSAYEQLVVSHLAVGEPERARVFATLALNGVPGADNRAGLVALLGEALLLLGETAAGEAQLRRAVELDPSVPRAAQLLGDLPH